MVVEIFKEDWRDIILKAHCFHYRIDKTTIIGSLEVYDWLITSEIVIWLRLNRWYQNGFPENDAVFAVFVFIAMAIQRAGAVSNMFSWMNWFCSARTIKVAAWVFQNLHSVGLFCKRVQLFVAIGVRESNTTSVKRTIVISETNVSVVAKHIKFGCGFDFVVAFFQIWI